jgi:hypothetical protein
MAIGYGLNVVVRRRGPGHQFKPHSSHGCEQRNNPEQGVLQVETGYDAYPQSPPGNQQTLDVTSRPKGQARSLICAAPVDEAIVSSYEHCG